MGTYEIGELASLFFDLMMMPLLFLVLNRGKVQHFGFFLLGALMILLSHIATVLEGFFFPAILNFTEHFSILLSGIFFLTGFLRYSLLKSGNS